MVTPKSHGFPYSAAAGLVIAAGLAIGSLTGCHWGGNGSGKDNGKVVRLSPGDFYDPNGYAATTSSQDTEPPESDDGAGGAEVDSQTPNPTPDATASNRQAVPGDADRTTTPPPPPSEYDRPMPQSGVLVGGLLGQINGRPIYIEDFFAPMAGELAIDGREMTRLEFAGAAKIKIEDRLFQMIRDELLLSEAESSLTEEQRMGLLYWLKQRRENVVRESGGYESAAQERALETRGVGVDEMIEQDRRSELVRAKLREEIISRIHISSRDVAQYYRTHPEEFDPPASIQLRLIFVKSDDQDTIAAVQRDLAADVPFEVVAGNYSSVLASKGGLWAPVELPDGLEESSPTGSWPEVDHLVRGLTQGDYGGPVAVQGNSVWAYVEKYDEGLARTLYDAQHEITDNLFKQRFEEEQARYFDRLMARSSIDNPQPMVIELVRIALERWGKPDPNAAENEESLGG
ncbi:MAG: peptidyl-prolyl cis-trans isomerase [Planctomycetes bacterium]|nr:peptidyl-prolyl cis-trans isomerase [Planctomycetota bacterium]